jgi:hypothetical protein
MKPALDPRELLLRRGATWATCQRLEALGVPGRFVCELGAHIAIGQARVQLSRRGDFFELPGPDARLLLGLFEGGELIDVAAVSTSHPGEVARLTGLGWCLGEERIEAAERAVLAGKCPRLRLVADPLEWLRCEGRAVCVIDWAIALPRLRLLGELVTIECDAGAGERIRSLLAHGGLPRVSERAPVPRIEQREAA